MAEFMHEYDDSEHEKEGDDIEDEDVHQRRPNGEETHLTSLVLLEYGKITLESLIALKPISQTPLTNY